MYQFHTAEQWKKYLQLPQDYHVDACLIFGSWRVEEYTTMMIASAKRLYLPIQQESILPWFISPIQSFLIGDKRIWFLVEYGGVRLSEYLHRWCMFGSQKNIFLWSCGGLKKGIQSCDIIIPTYSYGDESSTRMYKRSKDHNHYSDIDLSKKIVDDLQSLHTVYSWPIMTCWAMLAETKEDIDIWSKQWYYGVEMESATIFAVSNYFSIPSAGLIYISDNLIEGQTVTDDDYIQKKYKRNSTIQLLFEIALKNIF